MNRLPYSRVLSTPAPLYSSVRPYSVVDVSRLCRGYVAASARLHTYVFSLSLLLAAVPSPRAPPGTRCFPSLACSRLLPLAQAAAVTGHGPLLRLLRLRRLRLLPRRIPRRNTRTALLRALTPSSSTTAPPPPPHHQPPLPHSTAQSARAARPSCPSAAPHHALLLRPYRAAHPFLHDPDHRGLSYPRHAHAAASGRGHPSADRHTGRLHLLHLHLGRTSHPSYGRRVPYDHRTGHAAAIGHGHRAAAAICRGRPRRGAAASGCLIAAAARDETA